MARVPLTSRGITDSYGGTPQLSGATYSPGAALMQVALGIASHARRRGLYEREQARQNIADAYTQALTEQIQGKLHAPQPVRYSLNLPGGEVVEGLTPAQYATLKTKNPPRPPSKLYGYTSPSGIKGELTFPQVMAAEERMRREKRAATIGQTLSQVDKAEAQALANIEVNADAWLGNQEARAAAGNAAARRALGYVTEAGVPIEKVIVNGKSLTPDELRAHRTQARAALRAKYVNRRKLEVGQQLGPVRAEARAMMGLT